MQTIQPGQLVISVFGLAHGQVHRKTMVSRIIFSLTGAFLIVLAAALLMNLAIANFDQASLSFSTNQEKAAYLPGQAVSSQLSQGHFNLR